MIGQTVDGRYQVEALLGRGGMGAVYQATDLIDNQLVALKVLHFFLDGETAMALTRFHREFRVLARLDHPHIMRAYRYGSHDGVPYLVLEFLAGHTLAEELVNAPLSRSHILHIALQVCEALSYLHTQSIVHRDLKPGNLMLRPPDNGQNSTGPQVKLMDFGLVRQGNLSRQLTQEGTALGTVAYMAPEQAQGLAVDFRADLYALGTILYEMVTGQTPFMHENPAMVLMQQLTMPPPPPRQLNPALDAGLEQLILELLAKEPAQRPGSAELLASRLVQLADEAHLPVKIAPSPAANRADLIPRVLLIGRESAMAEVTQQWANAQSGRGQVILLAGAAGTGKSRLVTEASLLVQMGTGRFLSSRCQERTALPYQPVVNILRPLLRDLPAPVRQILPAELNRLLASTGGEEPPDPGPGDQAEARQRLFAGCGEVLRQATKQQPLMVTIENLQWAEPATLELLGYLIDQTEQSRLLLVLTYRPEEVGAGSDLAAFRRNLEHHRAARTLELAPLTRDQVARFLQAALGRTNLPDWLVDSFQKATGGNPLFIEETLKALAAEGQVAEWLQHDSSQWTKPAGPALQLPQNVLALAERRLQQLAAEDRAILTTGAVLGPEFSFALLQTMTKLGEDDLLDVIDRLLAARLIEELPLQAGEDRFRFAQEALRQALLNSTSQRRIRRLHQKAGEAIESVYDAGQRRYWPELAYHFGQAGDNERAIKYCCLAGDAAAEVYANVEATGYYRHALAVLDPTVASDQFLIDLYSRLGRVLELNSQFDDALANYEELEKLARQRNSRSMELVALIAQATILSFALRNLIRAEALMDKALSLARDLGDQAAEAKVSWSLSNLHSLKNRFESAIEYGERSLVLSRQLNLRQQTAYTLNDLARTYVFYGGYNQGREMAREARQLWREMENRPMLSDNLSLASIIALHMGHYDQAVEYSEEALQISQATNNNWGQSYSRMWVSIAYWEYGQPAEAIAVSVDGIRLGDLIGFVGAQIVTRAELALIYAGLGAPGRGVELINQALDVVATGAQFEFHRPIILAAMTQVQLSHGNLVDAETAISQAKPDPNQPEISMFVPPVLLARGELAFKQRDYSGTVAIMDDLLATLRQYGMRRYLPDALYLQGQALRNLGQTETGQERLLKAQTMAEAIGSRRMLWRVLTALSRLESNPTEAERLQQQAREIVTYIADHTSADLRDAFLGLPEVRAIEFN